MQLTQNTVARITSYFIVLLVLTLPCLWPAAAQQSQGGSDAEERVRRVLETLEPNNRLRYALERGDRGTGPHYAWMDQMRDQGVKQAYYRIRFVWSPGIRKLDIEKTFYLTHYYLFDPHITDESKLNEIDKSGLKRALEDAILARARKNLRQRAREMKTQWLCGVLYLNLLDDEVLPILDVPALYDGSSEQECKHAN
jgi:hypothetical protein